MVSVEGALGSMGMVSVSACAVVCSCGSKGCPGQHGCTWASSLHPQRETQVYELDPSYNKHALITCWCQALRGCKKPICSFGRAISSEISCPALCCRMCCPPSVRSCCSWLLDGAAGNRAGPWTQCPLVSPLPQESCHLAHDCGGWDSGARHHPLSAWRKHLLS